jgi:CYTH domain-containing protein
MPKEIERKFLIKSDFKKNVTNRLEIVQAYLSDDPERIVRIRLVNDKAFLTIKGKSNKAGLTRFEFEKEILIKEAKDLIELRVGGLIEKTRYIIPAGNGLFFEVDEFHGANRGLNLAEIELPEEDITFKKPAWLGKEVTGMEKYYNSFLSKNAYSNW